MASSTSLRLTPRICITDTFYLEMLGTNDPALLRVRIVPNPYAWFHRQLAGSPPRRAIRSFVRDEKHAALFSELLGILDLPMVTDPFTFRPSDILLVGRPIDDDRALWYCVELLTGGVGVS